MVAKPKFFIIGAPKCGTTALVEYLRTSNAVFIPAIKEPHFFCTDWPKFSRIEGKDRYLELFRPATPSQRCGDASVWYAYSQTALAEIAKFEPEAQIIFCVRDPIAACQSLYQQLRFSGREDAETFQLAWELQNERRNYKRLPANCIVPEHLLYADVLNFAEQYRKILDCFPAGNVYIMDQHYLKTRPESAILDVCDFLGVSPPRLIKSLSVNTARAHKWPWLSHLLMRPPFPMNILKAHLKRLLKIEGGEVSRWLYGRLSLPSRREQLDLSVRREMEAVFRPILEEFEALSGASVTLGRDAV